MSSPPFDAISVILATENIELLLDCVTLTLNQNRDVSEKALKELETSSATPLVRALRILRLQKIMLAVGMFSLFESALQITFGWQDPFSILKTKLAERSRTDLNEKLFDYYLAINVLKHGRGPSYQKLLARAPHLEFRIKTEGENFISEGDVSEVDVLVDVDDAFVIRCATLISETFDILKS